MVFILWIYDFITNQRESNKVIVKNISDQILIKISIWKKSFYSSFFRFFLSLYLWKHTYGFSGHIFWFFNTCIFATCAKLIKKQSICSVVSRLIKKKPRNFVFKFNFYNGTKLALLFSFWFRRKKCIIFLNL